MTWTFSATLQTRGARTRVTRFDFVPGARTGWHRHGGDDVIVALTACRMRLDVPGSGVREVAVPADSACRRDAGVKHNLVSGREAPTAVVGNELPEPR